METLGDNLVAKSGKIIEDKYYCEKCDYKCSKNIIGQNIYSHLNILHNKKETN